MNPINNDYWVLAQEVDGVIVRPRGVPRKYRAIIPPPKGLQ